MPATITVYEQSSPYDDFDTESGRGHADDVAPVEIDSWAVYDDDDSIELALAYLGLDEWDGGSVAYDPDGSHMAFDADGTITTRWAVIERPAPFTGQC